MPYVNVQLVGKLSKEQKKDIADRISDALAEVAGKPKQNTNIVFNEVNPENWAKGNQLMG